VLRQTAIGSALITLKPLYLLVGCVRDNYYEYQGNHSRTCPEVLWDCKAVPQNLSMREMDSGQGAVGVLHRRP
jgi:hypothetical protein